MRILAATDFSEPSLHALKVAAAMAKRLDDELILLFVVEPTLIASPDFMVDVESIEKAIEHSGAARLEEEAAALRQRGVKVRTIVKRGSVSDVIASVGKSETAGLVFLGTHGRRAVERFFLGSAAERVVLQSKTPVLVVRQTGDKDLQAWANGERHLHLMVGVEMSGASKRAIEWVRTIRSRVPCDITFVHFYWPPEQAARLGLGATSDIHEAAPETVAVLQREVATFIGELPGHGAVDFVIAPNFGELGTHLANLANEKHPDMLVIGTHQRRGLKRLWLGATMQPTLHAANVPVLCVPGGDETQQHAEARVPTIRQVLVTTDGSALGNSAVAHAYGLVHKGGTVHIAHVHERHLPNPLYAYDDSRAAIAGTPAEAKMKDEMLALVPRVAEGMDVQSEIHVIDGGYPPAAILQLATRLGVDSICIASHGRGGLGRVVMGSVASAILKGADRPVFVVRGARP